MFLKKAGKLQIYQLPDEKYCNIFPMDIHGYIKEEGIYILGLRTTNITLDKIIAAKKVVVSDTSNVAIDVVYTLGKQASVSFMNAGSIISTALSSITISFQLQLILFPVSK